MNIEAEFLVTVSAWLKYEINTSLLTVPKVRELPLQKLSGEALLRVFSAEH
jgi:hypothetical protein